jgi:5-methylthioadenosine/S-adenosylhomocysteine deaminase
MDKLGLFDYGGGAFHCVYFSDNDIKIFKEKNLTIVTNPGSNAKLASGIAPIDKYLKAGINLAIGTDGAGSNNGLDFFYEMRLASSLQKLSNNDASAGQALDLLKAATVGGAKALRLNDCDVLKEGKLADIIMIDLLRPSMQPINNIEKNLVYSGSKDIVKMTMINGQIRYMDGTFYVNEPIEEIYAKAQEITENLRKN